MTHFLLAKEPGNPLLKRLLQDFIFLDWRLGDHPRVRASLFWSGSKFLYLTSTHDEGLREFFVVRYAQKTLQKPFQKPRYGLFRSRHDHTESLPPGLRDVLIGPTHRSIRASLVVPVLEGEQALGVLCFDSLDNDYFCSHHADPAQLLAALIAYSRRNLKKPTPVSISLGIALKRVREGIQLTQDHVAEKTQQSRVAVSRWESGAQPPPSKLLYEWCRALGLVSPQPGPLITVVDITPRLLTILKENPSRLRDLSPDQFERLIAERLDRMGYDVSLTGPTSARDGGIDLIAVPKIRTVGAFLLAGQIKHHRGIQKTGREAVDRLLAWRNSHFRLGLLVTNTTFTKDARWVAQQPLNRAFLRLRDFADLQKWLADNFSSKEDWQEIPTQIDVTPGVSIEIPKPRLTNAREIWPIPDFTIEGSSGV